MATAPQLPSIADQYASADPFPHIVIDDYFAPDRIARIAAEVADHEAAVDFHGYGQQGKGGIQDRQRMGPQTTALFDELNGPGFLGWLGDVTGIPGLIADTALFGGGVHRIQPGGFLKMHTDFNWHAGLQLYRRVNVLVYLNPDWRDEWGGHLELWRPDMSECGARIAPILNRMVIFSTTDESYHGHPEPLACPDGVTRNSIALYYYTQEPTPSRFGQSEMTDYRTRPGETLGMKQRVHQLLLRAPRVRALLTRTLHR